jgi:hypothetical protein
MKRHAVPALIAALLAMALAAGDVAAQTSQPPSDASAVVAPGSAYAAGQLEQLLAPIALYPDSLLAQILMASTYPLDIVEADRWLQAPANAALQGDALAASLASQRWDPSVKSLVPFPRILRMMDDHLAWSEQLGDAFLADQAAVMDAVQQLRRQAQTAGTLNSNAQLAVSDSGGAIVIEPATPQTVYVPVYDPALAYGVWGYPGFPPDYFPGYFDGAIIGGYGFGWFGVAVVVPLWGWNRWDWAHHRIDIDPGRYAGLNRNRPPAGNVWHHDPSQRRGVPYLSPAVQSRFGASGGANSSFPARAARGYGAAHSGGNAPFLSPGEVPSSARVPSARFLNAPQPANPVPTYESYGRGDEVRAQAARGSASRLSGPDYAPHETAPRGGGGAERSGGQTRRSP